MSMILVLMIGVCMVVGDSMLVKLFRIIVILVFVFFVVGMVCFGSFVCFLKLVVLCLVVLGSII